MTGEQSGLFATSVERPAGFVDLASFVHQSVDRVAVAGSFRLALGGFVVVAALAQLVILEFQEELIEYVAKDVGYEGPIDFSAPWKRRTLREAIREGTGLDIASDELPGEGTWAKRVDDLLSKRVEPNLQDPTFILDYPKELSPFAKDHRSQAGLVERFECFAGGMEFANAFSELNDPDEQRARFEQQRADEAAGDEETQPYDEDYVRALEHGMPPTGGIGIGIDRLVMLLSGRDSIREVVLFPAMRN